MAGRNRRVRRRDEAGMTLVEILVVLMIIGLIASFAVPRVMTFVGGSRRDAAEIQVKRLASIVELYALDVGRPPTAQEGLRALVERPTGATRWAGPYLEGDEALTDPWGAPYAYSVAADGRDFVIASLGADGRRGGEGDAADIANR